MRACYKLTHLLALILMQFGCMSLPPKTDTVEQLSFQNTSDTRLGAMAQHVNVEVSGGEQAFLPLDNGHDALVARLALILQAEKSIDVQYYLYHNDTVGRLFTHYTVIGIFFWQHLYIPFVFETDVFNKLSTTNNNICVGELIYA